MNIYRTALQIQDASNPSGVIHTLSREIVPAIQGEAGYKEQGTRYLAEHPVMLLFIDKLASLTHKMYTLDEEGALSRAYDECHRMADAIESAEYELAAGLRDNPEAQS